MTKDLLFLVKLIYDTLASVASFIDIVVNSGKVLHKYVVFYFIFCAVGIIDPGLFFCLNVGLSALLQYYIFCLRCIKHIKALSKCTVSWRQIL